MRSEVLSGSKRNDDWITEGTIPDPTPLPKAMGWKILVRPVSPKKQTKGGIILPDAVVSDIAYLTTVGKVLSIGPLAFTRADMLQPELDEVGHIVGHRVSPWYKVGDYVTYGKYAGGKRIYKGVKLLILNDDEVLDVIDDPSDIDTSYNLSS